MLYSTAATAVGGRSDSNSIESSLSLLSMLECIMQQTNQPTNLLTNLIRRFLDYIEEI